MFTSGVRLGARAPLPGCILDGSVEIGFITADEQDRFADTSDLLFGDWQNVIAETIAYDLPNRSRTPFDRDLDTVPNGALRRDRLHVHLGRHDAAGDAFARTVQQLADADVDLSAVKVRVHQPEAADNDRPLPSSRRQHAWGVTSPLPRTAVQPFRRVRRRRALG